jgi:hypothetical protein
MIASVLRTNLHRYKNATLHLLALGLLTACQPTATNVTPAIARKEAEIKAKVRLVQTRTDDPVLSINEYSYTADNQLNTAKSYPESGGIWKDNAPTVQYKYNPKKQLIGTEGFIIKLDTMGKIVSQVQANFSTYEYDADGRLATYKLFVNSEKQAGRLFEQREYSYDELGRVVVETFVHYDEDPKIAPFGEKQVLTYLGDDVTSIDRTQYRVTITAAGTVAQVISANRMTFTYDDKPNAFYGLNMPDLRPWQRISRHNVRQITIQTIPFGNLQTQPGPINTYTYKLTYTPDGMLARSERNDGRFQTFVYESY